MHIPFCAPLAYSSSPVYHTDCRRAGQDARRGSLGVDLEHSQEHTLKKLTSSGCPRWLHTARGARVGPWAPALLEGAPFPHQPGSSTSYISPEHRGDGTRICMPDGETLSRCLEGRRERGSERGSPLALILQMERKGRSG